jgi:hypothetical protein
MFKSLASLLQKKPAEPPPAPAPAPEPRDMPRRDEDTPIYQSIALTEEMREALFPTTPRMVSAIFERPASSSSEPPPPAPPLAREISLFPIV